MYGVCAFSMASPSFAGDRWFELPEDGFFYIRQTFHGARLRLNVVVAEVAADGLADFALFEREGGLLELRDHLSAMDLAEIAAFDSGCGIVGFLFRDGGEIFTGLEAFANGFGFGAGCVVG